MVYAGVMTFVILQIIQLLLPLRVTPAQEREGLDLAQHDEQLSGS
jgi:Amt family ammonium transporter